jgi:integrase
MKNVTRIKTNKRGRTTWILVDNRGEEIEAFSAFCEAIFPFAFATQKRYAEVVSQFIDYLFEAGVFQVTVTKQHLNEVIETYPHLLVEGTSRMRDSLLKSIDADPRSRWLLNAVNSLDRKPLKPTSLTNTLAAINKFLRLSDSLAREAFELATMAGIDHRDNFATLIRGLDGHRTFTEAEVNRLRQNSVLGSVIRFRSRGMSRPRRLALRQHGVQDDTHRRDFPIQCVIPLANMATSKRDKALWLFLAASGTRASEARNLQWTDIDPATQEVFIFDPLGRRLGGDMTQQERIRFKGRTVSMTYLIQPFKQLFFEALAEYVNEEYVPSRDERDAGFVFQYIEPRRRGVPYVSASDASLNANFHIACERVSLQLEPEMRNVLDGRTLHSLRHMYGVYMVNDFPVDLKEGRFGLELSEVQILMGHKELRTTRHYARPKRQSLQSKLLLADQQLLGSSSNNCVASIWEVQRAPK